MLLADQALASVMTHEEFIKKCNNVEAYVQSIIWSSGYCDSKEEKIREATSKDPVALHVFDTWMVDGLNFQTA